ncbi:hypothetical protein T11_7923 [Trichinella zimbabwensis]|uniref:Uncharacterized protein n=2 Tax=Trichinella zimbabwensis TaxID=268475 RepID=A0A0V1H1E4_9BILA|nr:hypothetical protein T11_7923 [Trichinella zimbabwensis]
MGKEITVFPLLPRCPPRQPCPGDFPRLHRLQAPVLSFTIFAEMTLGGSENLRSTVDGSVTPIRRRRSLLTRWQLCSVIANSY